MIFLNDDLSKNQLFSFVDKYASKPGVDIIVENQCVANNSMFSFYLFIYLFICYLY